MATQAEIQTAIDAIDAKLLSGVEWVQVDQTSTRVNLESLRKERAELERRLTANRAKRPVTARIKLDGF